MDMQTAAPSNFYIPNMPSCWTEQRVNDLKTMWGAGLSASTIADRLGEVSRNAVIGKVHRLGLAGRATTQRISARQVQKAKAARKAAAKKAERLAILKQVLSIPPEFDGQPLPVCDELVIPMNERKTVMTLETSSCRWPIGDPQHDDFHFCGREHVEGFPYCGFHASRALQPSKPRDRSPAKHQAPRLGIAGLNAVSEWTAPIPHRIREPA